MMCKTYGLGVFGTDGVRDNPISFFLDLRKIALHDDAKKDAPLKDLALSTLIVNWADNRFSLPAYNAVLSAIQDVAITGSLKDFVYPLMTDKDGAPALQCGPSGIWTFNFPTARRVVVQNALQRAQVMTNKVLTFLNGVGASDTDKKLFNAYFGANKADDSVTLNKVIANFTAIQGNIAGTGKPKIFTAPPPPKTARGSTSTIAFVLERSYPKEKGAVIFLHDAFFDGARPLDDRASTIIHEASHYFCDTLDEDENGSEKQCYGDANCRRIAALGTSAGYRAALQNAETYGMFAMQAVKAQEGFEASLVDLNKTMSELADLMKDFDKA